MSTSVQLIQHEGKQITDEEEIVSAFNEHFINVGHSLTDEIKVKPTDGPAQHLKVVDKSTRFKHKSVTKHWVLTALKRLKESKSPGRTKSQQKYQKMQQN